MNVSDGKVEEMNRLTWWDECHVTRRVLDINEDGHSSKGKLK